MLENKNNANGWDLHPSQHFDPVLIGKSGFVNYKSVRLF
jgi:hypothetical protein